MIKLGITGGIGAGKSVMASFLKAIGIPVYLADDEAKRLVSCSLEIKESLIKHFGNALFPDGKLDKKLMASLIFNNPENLKSVNSIIHPAVGRDFDAWVKKNEKKRLIAMEAAILFESGFDKKMDLIVTVTAPLEERIERILKRENIKKEEILNRISNQWTEEEKIEKSNYVINNDNNRAIIPQIEELLKKIGISDSF